jgi:hypothetical protein
MLLLVNWPGEASVQMYTELVATIHSRCEKQKGEVRGLEGMPSQAQEKHRWRTMTREKGLYHSDPHLSDSAFSQSSHVPSSALHLVHCL